MDYDDILKVWTKREQELDAELLTLKTAYEELCAGNADEEIIDQAQIDVSYLEHKLWALKDAINILLSTHDGKVLV